MRAYLGLGSNVGDRHAMLVGALAALEERGVVVDARSRVYETAPVGGPSQPDFLNQVVRVETDLDPRSLLHACLDIESSLGRDRRHEVRWGPRPIDIDVLTYESAVVREPDLTIPHPRLAERAFVLVPLVEIDPDLWIPGLGTPLEMLRSLGPSPRVRATN